MVRLWYCDGGRGGEDREWQGWWVVLGVGHRMWMGDGDIVHRGHGMREVEKRVR
jgi:hypothetical protein